MKWLFELQLFSQCSVSLSGRTIPIISGRIKRSLLQFLYKLRWRRPAQDWLSWNTNMFYTTFKRTHLVWNLVPNHVTSMTLSLVSCLAHNFSGEQDNGSHKKENLFIFYQIKDDLLWSLLWSQLVSTSNKSFSSKVMKIGPKRVDFYSEKVWHAWIDQRMIKMNLLNLFNLILISEPLLFVLELFRGVKETRNKV